MRGRVLTPNGFTMVEVLTAIVVLGLAMALSIHFINPIGQFKKARDSERKAMVENYVTALETYATANDSLYPIHTTVIPANETAGVDLCDDLYPTFITECPADPQGNNYQYVSDSGGYDAGVGVFLETGDLWVVCTNGQSGEVANGAAATALCDTGD
jgi:prepilin-type N-terminal cleavage/methylation domain-containing protein